MADLVNSTLIVMGPEGILEQFLDFSKGKETFFNYGVGDDLLLDAHKYIPIPDEVQKGRCRDCGYTGLELMMSNSVKWVACPECGSKNTEDWYNNQGCDWTTENWGTRKGFCGVQMKRHRGVVQFKFFTEWNPIDKVIIAMSEKYPDLYFAYQFEDEDGSFYGQRTYKEGKQKPFKYN